ncbi:hypothetical protein Dimus_001500, partial [Dionaea muscipula]
SACCSVHGLLFSLTMGRRKTKKSPSTPLSQWTPVVQGLNSDVSDSNPETPELELPPSMKPIEEIDEENSEEENPSSIGAPEISKGSIDDAIAENDDVVTLITTDSGSARAQRLQELVRSATSFHSDPLEIHQPNPSNLISSMNDMGAAPDATPDEIMANPEHFGLGTKTLISEKTGLHARQILSGSTSNLPPSPVHDSSAQEGNPTANEQDNSKRQWSHLFANN